MLGFGLQDSQRSRYVWMPSGCFTKGFAMFPHLRMIRVMLVVISSSLLLCRALWHPPWPLWACFGDAEQHSPGTDGQGGLSRSQPRAREMQPGLTDPSQCQTQTSPLPSGLPYLSVHPLSSVEPPNNGFTRDRKMTKHLDRPPGPLARRLTRWPHQQALPRLL